MNATLTIQEFNALLTSEEESPLLEALRKLTRIEAPEDVTESMALALLSWWWRG